MVTSDKTAWMLRACLWLLDRQWPEHPPVLVGGYTRPENLPAHIDWHTIGDFADFPFNRWSNGVLRFLESVPDETFIWHMDDFWLCQAVDHAAVMGLGELLSLNPHLARIDLTDDRAKSGNAQPSGEWRYTAPGGSVHYLDLIHTPPNTPYQLSFQTGLWRRRALIQYMTPGEDPGQAEVRGANRMTLANANVLGTLQQPVKYLIAMQHGQLHIDDSGYQVPPVALLPEDKAELRRLGYLDPPLVPA